MDDAAGAESDMDLNTVRAVRDARFRAPWEPGDAWLAGGTYLFSEPQPRLRRLVDLGRMGWTPVREGRDGSVEIAATCTVAELSRYGRDAGHPLFEQCCRAFLASFKIWNMATVGGNLCNALPAGPMISLTAALDGVCLLRAQDGSLRRVPVADFVVGAGRTVLGRANCCGPSRFPAGPCASVRPSARRPCTGWAARACWSSAGWTHSTAR